MVINLDARLMSEPVRQLKGAGVRVAFWFPDAVIFLGRQLMLLSPYDALFFKEPHVVDRLRSNLDMPIYYLPEACNPRWHRPIVEAGTEPYPSLRATCIQAEWHSRSTSRQRYPLKLTP